MQKIKNLAQKLLMASIFILVVFGVFSIEFSAGGLSPSTVSACEFKFSHNGSNSIIGTSDVSNGGATYECIGMPPEFLSGSTDIGHSNATFNGLTEGSMVACTIHDSDSSTCSDSAIVENTYEGVCGPLDGAIVTTDPEDENISGRCYSYQNIYPPRMYTDFDTYSRTWNWQCDGTNDPVTGLNTSVSCSASVQGVCGTNANNGVPYAYDAYQGQWSESGLCSSGVSDSQPSFPAQGSEVTWKCLGTTTDLNVDCSASREMIPEGGSICGIVDKVPVTTAPTLNLCYPSDAAASSVSGSGPWTWTCTGSNGDAPANCSAPSKGICGTNATNSPYAYDATQPTDWTTTGLCTTEFGITSMPTFPIDGQSVGWICRGSDDTGNAQCQARKNVGPRANAICGSANSVASETPPAITDRCTQGNFTSIWSESGFWKWTCYGTNGGASASCSAPVIGSGRADGFCGPANGTIVSQFPSQACSVGLGGGYYGYNPFLWSCAGINGGATANCYSADPEMFYTPTVSIAGGTYYSTQSVYLSVINPNAEILYSTDGSDLHPYYSTVYSPGTPIIVSENKTIKAIAVMPSLNTAGSMKRASTVMRADYVISTDSVNGACGSANNTTVSAVPTSNLCSAGTANTVTGTGPWSWNCLGSGGGSDASCSAQLTGTENVDGACGLANGVATLAAPIFNFCSAGIQATLVGSGPWSWTCVGLNGGSVASCSAPLLGTTPPSNNQAGDSQDNHSTSSSKHNKYHKKYMFYRGLYRNEMSLGIYQEVRTIKRNNPKLFAQWKAIFIAHKHDSKNEINALDAKTNAIYWKYKNYNGYRNYKIYKVKNAS